MLPAGFLQGGGVGPDRCAAWTQVGQKQGAGPWPLALPTVWAAPARTDNGPRALRLAQGLSLGGEIFGVLHKHSSPQPNVHTGI